MSFPVVSSGEPEEQSKLFLCACTALIQACNMVLIFNCILCYALCKM